MWEAAGEPQGLRFKRRWVPHFSRSLREVGFLTFFQIQTVAGIVRASSLLHGQPNARTLRK
jgi:hypothetical protein